MVDAGASVKFETLKMGNWVQYDEGIFLPAFLEDWFGKATFANSAEVEIPMVAFAVGSLESRQLASLGLERLPMFTLKVSDSRNKSKIDLDVFSKLVNSKQVEYPEVWLHEPSEETVKALNEFKRPFYLRLTGVLSEESMEHLQSDSPVQFVILNLNDPPGQTSWLNFLSSKPNCVVMAISPVSAASLQTIDPEKPLGKLNFQSGCLDDEAILELAKLSKARFVSIVSRGIIGSQASIDAMCMSPVSMEFGPVSLTAESVQLLVDNIVRTKLGLWVSSIDSNSLQRLAEVKSLTKISMGFELAEQDIQSIALFPEDIEIMIGHNTNKSQVQQINEAIKNRKVR